MRLTNRDYTNERQKGTDEGLGWAHREHLWQEVSGLNTDDRNAERPGLKRFRSSGSHLGPFLCVLNPCVKESGLGPTSSGRTRYTATDKGEFPRSSGISVHFGFGITYLWHAVSRLRSCLLLLPHFTDILYFLLVDKYLQVFTPVSLSGECKYKKK